MILLQILRLKNIKVPAAAHFGHQGCVGKHLRDASDPLCRAFVLFCSSDSSVLTQLPTMKMDENGGKAMTLQRSTLSTSIKTVQAIQMATSHQSGKNWFILGSLSSKPGHVEVLDRPSWVQGQQLLEPETALIPLGQSCAATVSRPYTWQEHKNAT